MIGKKVNLLNKGSGSNVNCRNIMEGAGILDKIEVRNLGFSDSARALGDRQIDVFCSAGAPFLIPALTQLSITKLGDRQLGQRRNQERGAGRAEDVDLTVAERTRGVRESEIADLDLVEDAGAFHDVAAVDVRPRTLVQQVHLLADHVLIGPDRARSGPIRT